MLFSTFGFYCACACILFVRHYIYVIVKSFELKWIYDFK